MNSMGVNPFEGMLGSPAVAVLFDGPSVVGAMLAFEAALARAEAAAGLIPAEAAEVITGACDVDLYDVAQLVEQSRRAGSLAIPVVKQLTEAVAARSAEAAGYVHWGSTSQDVIDTAMALVTRAAVALIGADLDTLCKTLVDLADTHAATPMLGRTLMQPAVPITFGFKLVEWAAPLVRARARLRSAAQDALQLQLGGAVGTLGSLGAHGPAVAQAVGAQLGLAVPPVSWQTQRDRWIGLACEIGVLCGSLGKIGRDLSLLAQAEVAELAEPSGKGRGGSSAMPHKRNPVSSMIALSTGVRTPQRVASLLAAMPQAHERGLGDWQAELAEWPGLFIAAHGALLALNEACAGLEVDSARMLRNIDALQGLVFAGGASLALAAHIGRKRAFALLEELSRQVVASGRPLADFLHEAVAADPALQSAFDRATVDALFDPRRATAVSATVARAAVVELRAAL